MYFLLTTFCKINATKFFSVNLFVYICTITNTNTNMKSITVLQGDDIYGQTDGSSKTGDLRNTTFADLKRVLGEPTWGPEDSGDGKVQYEWAVEFEGDIFTIYDWKTFDESYTLNKLTTWSVGGKVYSGDFETFIESLIKNKTMPSLER